MRRFLTAVLLAGAVLLVPVAPASAARVVTWLTSSRFVDPATQRFNSPPPGVSPRPNALRVDVLLPDGYTRHRRYAVLYLLHGHGDSFDSWVNPRLGDLLHVARGFPGIVVMPEAAQGWYTNWWNGGRRGAPGWERYHLDELIPLVERRLPIRAGRRNHAIAGLSMGGEGALFYASQRPGYFGAAASFSGTISIQRPEWPAAFNTQGQRYTEVYGDPDAQRFYATGHNPTALAANLQHTRTFVTVGDGTPDPTARDEVRNVTGQLAERELRLHAQDFVDAARAAGVDVTYQPRQGIHAWRYWREHLAAAIRWGFFRPVAQCPTSWSYQTVAQHSRAWGLRIDFTRAPRTVETFTRRGGELRGEGSGTVAIHPARGPARTVSMPFRRSVSPACTSRSRARTRHPRPRHRRHRRRSHPRFAG